MRWLPVAALVAVGLGLFAFGRHHGLSDEVVGGLVGSLIGAAAILSGVLFDRRQRRLDESQASEERHKKLKALITAELVNLAAGMIDAKRFMDAAVRAAELGHPGPRGDLSSYMPRPMPFTNNLGVELLVLSQREIDVLVTLRVNLITTETSIKEEAESKQAFNLLAAKRIQSGLRHDMSILAEAFREYAPERKFALDDKEAEQASVVLSRLSKQGDD